jgi:hypothetical protein
MSNVGTTITHSGKWMGGHLAGAGKNIGSTLQKTFTNPVQAAKAGFNWSKKDLAGHPINTALTVGGTAMGVNDLRKKQDPTGRDRGRLERVGDFAGQTAGGLIGAPHGITGGIAGSIVGGKILGGAGKVADKAVSLVRRKPAPPPAQPNKAPVVQQRA